MIDFTISMRKIRQNPLLVLVFLVLLCTIVFQWIRTCEPLTSSIDYGDKKDRAFLVRDQKRAENYENSENEIGNKALNPKNQDETPQALDREMPLIFIGGVPRSGTNAIFDWKRMNLTFKGTTLMRAMLDAHPDIRCGEETRVIPRILGMRGQWKNSEKEAKRLLEAGLTDEVIDAAISSFILEIILKHGSPAKRLCNKDPFTLKSTEYLSSLFPNAKFILMIRDGRATVHSIIKRKVTITGFDLKSYRQCLEKWNQAISAMYHQCYLVGEGKCFPMYYEQLVLHPETQMRALLKFLNIPWNETVLHHEELIGKEISLSKTERSTDQVVKPVNLASLSDWVGHLPEDVVRDMATIAPMLAHLGYDPKENPPNYGKADPIVIKNTNDLQDRQRYWDQQVNAVYNMTKENSN